MKGRVLLVVSSLMALTLFLAACGTTTTSPTSTNPTTPTSQTTSTVQTSPTSPVSQTTQTTVASEKPKYGGFITVPLTVDITSFDTDRTMVPTTYPLTNDELMTGDWTIGPTGTGEANWTSGGTNRPDQLAGALATSWESPEPGHIIFHLRKGVRWALDPNNEASRFVNGREMTADDVLFSIKRATTGPQAYIKMSYPGLAAANVTAPDKYTVDIKVPLAEFSNALGLFPDLMAIVPADAVQKYGNLNNWKLNVGTGPFMITEFVPASSATLIKNPKYYGTNPMGPGKDDQLPYVDKIQMLIIPDVSTLQAALRTGRLDWASATSIDDLRTALKGAPVLKSKQTLAHTGWGIAYWVNKQNLPFKDLRVRQAMMLATNFNTIKDQLYGGDAVIQSFPNPPQKEYQSIFYPLSEMPASTRELYSYNPDKAKALLKEAGYPNGFKAPIICSNTQAQIDYLSVIKDMWAKVGIEITIGPVDSAVYSNVRNGLTYDQMILSTAGGAIGRYFSCNTFNTPSYFNASQVDDPKVKEAAAQMADLYNTLQWNKMDQVYKNLMPYVLEQSWEIPRPQPYGYNLWWPWIKNYSGESSVGYTNQWGWIRYVWLDQDLKKSMGH